MPHITLDLIMNIVKQTSDLKDSRLKNFIEFFPVSKDNIIQIDLKSIKDAAGRMAISKQQLDKVFKKDLSSLTHAILPLHNNNNALSYNSEIEFYINQTEIFANCHNYERLDVVAHGAYNINNLHFFIKNIRQWLLCEDVANEARQSKLNTIVLKCYFGQEDNYLNLNTKNFNQLSDFGFALQNWIESL
jgi:hypothetical protein